MTPIQRLLRRPQSLWLRQLTFQLHLWIGLLLTLYLILIGMTGSILVFRVELEKLCGLKPWGQIPYSTRPADIRRVLTSIEAAYPGRRIVSVSTPAPDEPLFVAVVQGRRERNTIAIHPQTAAVLGVIPRSHSWLSVVRDLHVTLLAGIEGRIANGIGGALLLLINLTGILIWWPGLKRWRRALVVDPRRSWRRINFDLHSAVGFWALSILCFWAVSGIYFGWPRQVFLFIDSLSPIINSRPPVVTVPPIRQQATADIYSMIAKARALDTGATLAGINFPYSRRAPFEVWMRRGNGVGWEYTDTLYFNPWDGAYLRTWQYGINKTWGDWFIWLQVPLHFGTFWGLSVKILWALLGLTVPLLALTGALMYWNRFLRHRWKLLRTKPNAKVVTAA